MSAGLVFCLEDVGPSMSLLLNFLTSGSSPEKGSYKLSRESSPLLFPLKASEPSQF